MSYKNITKDFLVEHYLNKKKSAKTISLELKCGETTIFRALEYHNIKRRTSKENQNPLYGKEPKKEELLELHYNKHISINNIAKGYNTSWSNIKRLFNEYEIKTKSHDEIIKPKDFVQPTKEQLNNWVWKENLTTTQIGGKLNVTSATIRKLCKKLEVPMKKTIKDRKPKGYWTEKRVIEEIQEINKNKEKLSPRFISLNKGKLFKAANKFFGNWGNAITKAGIDYNQILKESLRESIKNKDTKPELTLKRLIVEAGLDKGLVAQYPLIIGKIKTIPDFAYPEKKIAIYVDGDYWHGRNFGELNENIRKKSIEKTMLKDALQHRAIYNSGWISLRIWEGDIIKHPKEILDKLIKVLNL